MGNYRPFLQGPLPVANYTRIIIPGRFWTRPPSTKSTRMASSATPLHDSLIELAIPDAHAHAIKWYLNTGAFFTPIEYTLPDGLQSVNGSSSTGSCQPESCVMIPISGTAINGCDCPNTSPVSGVLIDGATPSIDTTQQGWARELFTVNRNGQDSIVIGFWFSSEFSLRGIEIAIFHCPVLGIGITGVKVYSSFIFPSFISAASSLLITYNSLFSDNCQSLSTISIPIQPPMASSSFYFIEFLFTGGSSVNQLNWLHLAEIRFSDEAFTSNTTTTESEGEIRTGLIYIQ